MHDKLHGFREGRGMDTSTLEANLDQQLGRLAHEPLFQVLLDVCKAYDSLDMGGCLEIMRGYGLGPKLDQLLKNY